MRQALLKGRIFPPSLALLLSAIFSGCLGTYPDNTISTPTSTDGTVSQSTCGAVSDGEYINPVSPNDGVPVTIDAVPAGNLVVATDNEGHSKLVRLHGLSSGVITGPASQLAIDSIQSFAAQAVYLVDAGCEESVGGAPATVGSIFSNSGKSLAEYLAASGIVAANPNDSCSGSQLGQCLDSVSTTNPITAGDLGAFLWKPTSDSNGHLAVHTGPFGTTVVINGETGVNQGPGNGFGSLARFDRGGCGYPSPHIQVFSSGGLPYTVGGKTTFSVPNPCGRFCLEGDSIVACSK